MAGLRRTEGTGERGTGGPGRKRFSTRARVITGAAAALAVLALLAVAEFGGSPGTSRAMSSAPASPGTNHAAGVVNPNPSAQQIAGPTPPPVDPTLTVGRANAPVTMVEFADFQCTNCGAFARDTEPALVRMYVDAGVVRLVWRDFPWVDGQSVAAAVAARAAGMQGKFWAYHDYLYAHQSPDEHSGIVTDAYLRSVARRLGLNMAVFNRDFAMPTLTEAVRADKAYGEKIGVSGTPAFLIGGRPFFGAQPLLAVYAAGMTAPLFGLAAAWDRLRIGQRRWLRGTGIRVGPLHLHTHSAIAGLLFTALGVIFLRYQGTAGLTGLLAPPSLDGWNNRLQVAVTAIQAHVPDPALIAAAAAVVIAVTAWRLRRSQHAASADTPASAEASAPGTPGTSKAADGEPARQRSS